MLSEDASLEDFGLLSGPCQTRHDLVAMIELSLVPLAIDTWLALVPFRVPLRLLMREDNFDQPFQCLIGWNNFGMVGKHPQMMTQAGSTTVKITGTLS